MSEQPAQQTAADDPLNRLSMTVLMTPDMSNSSGNVHGGLLLELLDQVACTCASRYARACAVTLSVDTPTATPRWSRSAPTGARCRCHRWCRSPTSSAAAAQLRRELRRDIERRDPGPPLSARPPVPRAARRRPAAAAR